MQQAVCRAAKELVLRLIRAVCAQDQTIDRVLPYEVVDFDHRTTCHHQRFVAPTWVPT